MPTMVIFKGHPGTGKSSLCRELSRTLLWPLIDKDDSKDVLVAYPNGPSDQDANIMAYSIMLRTAETQLAQGLSVILDSPLSNVGLYHDAAAAAQGCFIVLVECVCSDQALWESRLKQRNNELDSSSKGHKPTSWSQIELLLSRYQGSDRWTEDKSLGLEMLKVDSARSTIEQGCQAIINFLVDRRQIERKYRQDDCSSVTC